MNMIFICYFQVESSHEGEELSRGYKEARLRNIQDIKTKFNQIFPGKSSLSSHLSEDAGQGRGVRSKERGQGPTPRKSSGRKDESGSGSTGGKNN